MGAAEGHNALSMRHLSIARLTAFPMAKLRKQISEKTKKSTKPQNRLSLFPLRLEDALRAIMQTGAPPKDEVRRRRNVPKRKSTGVEKGYPSG